MLPDKIDGGLRIDGQNQQVQPGKILPAARTVDRPAGFRRFEYGRIAVVAEYRAVGVFMKRLRHRPADESEAYDADAQGKILAHGSILRAQNLRGGKDALGHAIKLVRRE